MPESRPDVCPVLPGFLSGRIAGQRIQLYCGLPVTPTSPRERFATNLVSVQTSLAPKRRRLFNFSQFSTTIDVNARLAARLKSTRVPVYHCSL
eukprot:3505858-Rhodomonas_salina.1